MDAPSRVSGKRRRSESRPADGARGRPGMHASGGREEEEERHPVKIDTKKYERGEGLNPRRIDDRRLKTKVKATEATFKKAREAAAYAEILLPSTAGFLEAEGPMERTYKFSQPAIAAAASVAVSRKAADLTLDTYGPYSISYTRSGRHMLLGGSKGHIAVVDWNFTRLVSEFHVGETVRDACFLHNQTMFAVAQRKYAYIYDSTGAEVHVLRSAVQPLALDFLPYHFLLVSLGNAGFLKYQDVSTGDLVAEHRTKAGGSGVMRQNPWNAVMHVGQANGVVSLWTPNMSNAVVSVIAHRGPVTALAVDGTGRYMVTAGADARMKVWDIRAFRDDPVYSYFTPTPASSMDISQRGMLAVSFGCHTQVWGQDVALELSRTSLSAPVTFPKGAVSETDKHTHTSGHMEPRPREREEEEEKEELADDVAAARPPSTGGVLEDTKARYSHPMLPKGVHKAAAPYMLHDLPGRTVSRVRFRPYDDILAIGHAKGVSTLIVPGAGEPNFDSREADPFQSKKARGEAEVHGLLDKLAASMITMEPSAVGAVDRAAPSVLAAERAAVDAARADKAKKAPRGGKSSKSLRKLNRKNKNVITKQRQALVEKLAADKAAAANAASAAGKEARAEDPGRPTSALDRFYTRPK